MTIIWRKPGNHVDDRYFCLTKILGFAGMFEYSNILSAIRPVPRDTTSQPLSKSPKQSEIASEPDELDEIVPKAGPRFQEHGYCSSNKHFYSTGIAQRSNS